MTENIVFEAETFWEKHKRRILGGLAVIIMVAAGVGLWFWNQQNEGISAQKMLAQAKQIEDLPKVADDYAGTPAAAEALLRQGELTAQAGQWEASAGAYRRFLEIYPKHMLAANALMGLGAAQEALGRFPEAEDSYKRVFEQHRQSHRAAEARLALGELLAAQGRDREAREAFDELMSAYPQSVWVQLARREAQALERKTNVAGDVKPAAAAPKASPAPAQPSPKVAEPQKSSPPVSPAPQTNPAPPTSPPAQPAPKAANPPSAPSQH